jgi:hypothetical protein
MPCLDVLDNYIDDAKWHLRIDIALKRPVKLMATAGALDLPVRLKGHTTAAAT